jgi:hypothetical protein
MVKSVLRRVCDIAVDAFLLLSEARRIETGFDDRSCRSYAYSDRTMVSGYDKN